jgi:hypothetical protein
MPMINSDVCSDILKDFTIASINIILSVAAMTE